MKGLICKPCIMCNTQINENRTGSNQYNCRDLSGNKTLILDAYHNLVEQGADLIVFPETCRLWLSSKGFITKNQGLLMMHRKPLKVLLKKFLKSPL